MKKLTILALAIFLGLLALAPSADAGRTGCKRATATEWKIAEKWGGTAIAVGTSGNDVFVPRGVDHDGPFVIFGLGGDDIICGSSGDDVIFGGPGDDIIRGRKGDDVIHGNEGDDILRGGRGADRIHGGEGNDVIRSSRRDIVDPGKPALAAEPPATPEPTVPPLPATPEPWSPFDGEPASTPVPSAVPTSTPVPSAVPTSTPVPSAVPTSTPVPTAVPASTPVPPSGNSSLPGSYAENLALIQDASATADERKAMIWDTYQSVSFQLNNGNPNRYTPSDQLKFSDYVHHRGSQYGPDKGRGPTGGVFHATCQFSHLAYDDPIVFPDQPGRSHLHMFFGNTHANAYSTSDSILNEGGSTCSRGELNRTSYWIPAALDGNKNVLVPDQFMVYYESYGLEWDTLQAFPEGLKMVNGNAMATAVQPDIPDYGNPAVVWKCGWYTTAQLGGGGASSGYSSTPPNCDDSQYSHIEMQIKWPFCWDGQNLDSPNHKDHVVFPQAGHGFFYPGACPASHPVTLPRVTYRVHFSTQTVASPTSQILLSSDIQPASGALSPNGVSGHGDWFGGWNRELLDGMVDRCILTGAECDEMHYGTPGGEQAAATLLESRVITPQQVVEYCPLRSQFDGNIYNVAYCRQ